MYHVKRTKKILYWCRLNGCVCAPMKFHLLFIRFVLSVTRQEQYKKCDNLKPYWLNDKRQHDDVVFSFHFSLFLFLFLSVFCFHLGNSYTHTSHTTMCMCEYVNMCILYKIYSIFAAFVSLFDTKNENKINPMFETHIYITGEWLSRRRFNV